ncbi:MAG: hypothetical protein ACRDLL_18035, partial [Solirubrobacterales bacterium]
LTIYAKPTFDAVAAATATIDPSPPTLISSHPQSLPPTENSALAIGPVYRTDQAGAAHLQTRRTVLIPDRFGRARHSAVGPIR